jgi:Glycosyl hydrolase family 20, domain 2/Concanavalin A-like lectin/glucanases superfamily
MSRKFSFFLVIFTLQVSFLFPMLHAVAGSSDPLPELKTAAVPQWENLKGIDIIPCPKQITVYDTSIPINDNLAILIGKSSSVRSKAAASDLRDIIREKTSIDVPVMVDGENTGQKNLIVLGTSSELPRIKQYCKLARISLKDVEKQGYAIFSSVNAGKQNIILAGKDEQGVYWAAMTLSYLIKNKTIRMARIIDWPDFKHRVCETLMRPMQLSFRAKTKKQKKAAWELVKKGIREAARLKFNYVRCFAILHSRPHTDYPLDIRAEMMRKAGAYANKRGIKLYIVLSTVVATEGDEKKFPQLKDCLKFKHLYVSWSDDQLIDHACDKITRMIEIIGPQQYFIHSPDVPYMGWNRRSENDRKRWGDDRIPAEIYLVNKVFKALKKGSPGAGFSYVSNPYGIGSLNASPGKIEQLKIIERLSPKLPKGLSLLWREGSLKSARKFRQLTKNQPQEYYIENSSFHKNRLLGGTARTAKTYYFKNSDNDFFYDNCNTSTHPAHKPQNGILAEYAWNTQAPGCVFISQSNADEKASSSKWTGMMVDGMPWGEWMTVHDLDGPLRKELIPRSCRQFFGKKVGNTLALAYAVGSSINDNGLGGMATIPYDRRYKHSTVFAKRLAHANTEMAKLWGKPGLFKSGSYQVYQMAFKYVYIYQYIEKINAYLMRLSWIAETGKDEDKVATLTDKALAYIKKAKKELAAGYKKYRFQSIRYAAIYGAKIGKLNNVYKKIDNLENAINFKNKQIKMFGAGNIIQKKKATTIGIAPPPAAFKLDGKLDEWNMASANILDKSFYNRKLGKQGLTGSKDVIAYWTTAWDKAYLYIAVLVFDDKLFFPEYSPLYKNDAVELWINKQQFIFSITPDGKAAVEPYCNYDKNKVKIATQRGKKAHQLHPDMKYWSLELKIPVDCLKTTAEIGNSFYMALGVDDADPREKTSQLFFPDTYQHLSMTPGASYTRDFARVVLQPKAELTTTLIFSRIKDVAKSDGTYTCIDLELALDSKERTVGISSEILLYAKDGIRRFKVDIPEILAGKWKKTLQIVTDDLYDSNTGVDLVLRAPGYYKKFELRKGKYRDSALGLVARSGSSGNKQVIGAKKREPLFETTFDNGSFALRTKNGKMVAPVTSTGCTIVDSRKGKAVKIDNNGALKYKLPRPQLLRKGIIEFWIKPDYSHGDRARRAFINLTSANSCIRFIKNLSYSYMFIISVKGKTNIVHVKTNRVKPDSWNYIALQWDETKKSMQLNINGVETTRKNVNFSLKQPFRVLTIGNIKQGGKQGCNSTIDELKIKTQVAPDQKF